jgi:single-strand DNA-binding protein
MINKVILLGNLGKDPEVRHLESGGMVARFPLATNENRRDKNGQWQKYTEWHDITAWGMLAERISQQLHKGSLVYVEGKITHRKWQDREGRDRYSTEIVANVIRNLERKDSQRGAPGMENTDEQDAGAAGDDDLPF